MRLKIEPSVAQSLRFVDDELRFRWIQHSDGLIYLGEEACLTAANSL
jgi:hypothetical protein